MAHQPVADTLGCRSGSILSWPRHTSWPCREPERSRADIRQCQDEVASTARSSPLR